MSPVALIAVVEVLDVLDFVVAHHHKAAGSLNRAKVMSISQNRHLSRLPGYNATVPTVKAATLTHLRTLATLTTLTLTEGPACLHKVVLNL